MRCMRKEEKAFGKRIRFPQETKLRCLIPSLEEADCVCYDIRFIELIRLMTLKGAEFILVPAAFNMITGPAHWELVIRSQAMYNQIFVLGTSLARDPSCGFISWGHSMSADPGGMVLSRTEEKEDIIFTDIDLSRIGEARTQLPMLSQRREDIYELRLL